MTPKIIELQRRSASIANEARGVLSEIQTCSDEARLADLARRHDGLLRDFDQARIDLAEAQMNSNDDEARAAMRPISSGEARGDADWRGTRQTGWVDEHGKEVRVLTRGERLSTGREEGPSLGQIMRAMVTGPRNDAERRALAEGTDSAGGYTVPAPLAAQFIDKFRARSVVGQAGAQAVVMDRETLALARLETDPTVAWRAENAAVADGDPTFGRVLLAAKSLAGMTKVSRELLDDSVNVAEMLENAFAQAVVLEIDRACIYGTGLNNQPTGIGTLAGVTAVEMGANGAALANYDKLIDTLYQLQLANAGDPTAMIWHPRTGAALAKLKDTANNPLAVPGMVASVPKLATTSVPINQTQGTATTASSVIVGDFSQMLIGVRQSLRIELLKERYAENHQYAFVAHCRIDMQPTHLAAFAKLIGIIP